MSRLFNEPSDFAAEMIDGFVAANARWVAAVPGGVVRSTVGERPKVAIVIGGGSGHYPAFGGLVGAGLADGAAMGDVFASPSANQVMSVATTVDEGRGVLLTYGNYAGDVLHFEHARALLRERGIDCRSVRVTDDVASAPAGREDDRRGIAGDLVVFKTTGAAAEEGRNIDDVERIAMESNRRVRSIGVAFGGCTLPGADAPLFDVEPGRMAVGLGIHGEQGLDVIDLPTADVLADVLVGRLLAEAPPGAGSRLVPILNGLGGIAYEDLFVVYRRVHASLVERGYEPIDPQVGEFCTSFDMAGASLSLFWPDDELEELWLAPAETAAFRRGTVAGPSRPRRHRDDPAATQRSSVRPGSASSHTAASHVVEALETVADVLAEHADELGRLDAVSGDGDHGIGMRRGSRAAAASARSAVAAGAGLATTLRRAATGWSDAAGGTSGALWGCSLDAAASVLGDDEQPSARVAAEAVMAAATELMAFGGAAVGDKTMVDAAVPFAEELRDRVGGGEHLGTAWRRAAAAAVEAAAGTADMSPRKGRARIHAEQAIGVPDAGAVSFGIVVNAVADLIERTS